MRDRTHPAVPVRLLRVRWFVPVVDLLLVVLFCAIGRRSHEEAVLTGLLHTVWPFAVGLVVGWVGAGWLLRRQRKALATTDLLRVWPTGVLLWLATLIVGMLLRGVSGQGTAVSFIAVAAIVLAVFLLGWRAAAGVLTGLGRTR